MNKLSEKKFLSLDIKYREAECKFYAETEKALKQWLQENNNRIDIPNEYINDFKIFVDGSITHIDSINYDEKEEHIYLFSNGSRYKYYWAFAHKDRYVIDVIFNFYFQKPPLFPII